jgi:hypothetical protein
MIAALLCAAGPAVFNMSISMNRHHAQRMKAKFYNKQKKWEIWGKSEKSAGIYANHGCSCSCWMCGNPRRKLGELTLQEIKAGSISDQIEQ